MLVREINRIRFLKPKQMVFLSLKILTLFDSKTNCQKQQIILKFYSQL